MDWKVFQTDVLDALKQYEGYFDFFERTGTLSDNSRPDCIGRVSRDVKKIWVFDAKNKAEIDKEDEERMEKYVEQLKSSPVDIGLEHSELSKHEIEPVFITRGNADSKFSVVESKKLHQFLRKNLIYTETDRVVRDVAQMTEKKGLSHSQARLLYRSLRDFRENMDKAKKHLKDLESRFTDLKLEEPPFEEEVPVDYVLKHGNQSVYLDVPYKDEDGRGVREFLEEDSIYVSLGGDGEYGCSFEKFEEKLMKSLGIMAWDKVADIYTPKIPVETKFERESVLIQDKLGTGFKIEIKSFDDKEFKIAAEMPEDCLKKIRNQSLNSRKEYGEIRNGRFHHSFKVKKGLEIEYGATETLEAYQDTVNSIFQSAVNPKLSRKVRQSK